MTEVDDMAFSVIVGVALHRPLRPEPDEYRKVVVLAPDHVEAQLVACYMAGFGTVMPVSTEIEWAEY